MQNEQSYDKFYLKRDPATGYIVGDGETPVLGECAKRDCRLEPRHAKILNRGWRNSGIYYQEVVKKIEVIKENEDKDPVKTDSREALETEANELGISFRSNIGDTKLQSKINEAKDN